MALKPKPQCPCQTWARKRTEPLLYDKEGTPHNPNCPKVNEARREMMQLFHKQ